MSNLPSIIGGLVALAAVNKLLDTKPTAVTPTLAPLIPTTMVKPTVTPVTKPTTYAKPAKPITPFKTVQERAEEAAFIARQQKMTREQLLGRFGL